MERGREDEGRMKGERDGERDGEGEREGEREEGGGIAKIAWKERDQNSSTACQISPSYSWHADLSFAWCCHALGWKSRSPYRW